MLNTKICADAMKPKDIQSRGSQKTPMIRISADLKCKLEDQKKQTGETLSNMVERAIANLLDTNQNSPCLAAEQERIARQLNEIAIDLRKIINKINKITPKKIAGKQQDSRVVVIGSRHPWRQHPQKEKIFQVVRDMHRVGANLTMIASDLRLEGLHTLNGDNEWTSADVGKIVADIKKERDFLPPLYSLPE